MRLRPGTRIEGRYEVVGEQGEGPAYRAYHALDHEVEVEVVLWSIRGELLPDEQWRRRFVAAALRVRALGHPTLRKIFAAGVHEDGCWLALQPLPAATLATTIAAGKPMEPDELRRIGAALGDALAAAHLGGFVHGFLAPEDVAMPGGEPKLAGVGLWPHLEPAAARAAFGAAGRPLAPELLRGALPGPSTDVWGLALLLGELAAGASVVALGGVASLRARLEQHDAAVASGIVSGLVDEPALRPEDPLLLMHRFGAIDDLAVPTLEIGVRAQTGDPTAHFVKLAPEELAQAMAAAGHARKPAGGADVEDSPSEAPTDAPPPRRVETDPLTEAEQAGDFAFTPEPVRPARSGGVRATPPSTSAFPRPATPGPVSPRAPSHRPGDRVLPSSSSPLVPTMNMRRPSAVRVGVRRWRGPLLALGLVVVAALLGLAVAMRRGGPAATSAHPRARAVVSVDAGAPPAPPDAGIAAGARSLEPCPRGMVLVSGSPGVCIDKYEAPGEGFTPATNLTLEEARRACLERGVRLCSAAEWERACRGENAASYPYGVRFAPDRCNVRGGKHAALAKAGAFKDCVSAAGAYDMSGNASEWVQEAQVRGGSAGDGHDGRCSRATHREPDAAGDDVGYRCCIAPGAY